MNQPPPSDPAKYLRREEDGAAREFYRRLGAGRLSTTRCERCGRTTFPPRARCAGCGEPAQWIDLPRHGRLFAFTTQEAALRFRAPDVLALAEIGDVVVPGILDAPLDRLAIGDEVDVVLRPEEQTGLTLLAFEPRPARGDCDSG